MMRPTSRSWLFESKNHPGFKRTVRRTSHPLMPYNTCSLYSLQGTTAKPGLIAHFTMPRRTGEGMQWLIVYVLLSRPPSLARLRSIGLDDKIRAIIEKGPPTWLLDAFERLKKNILGRRPPVLKPVWPWVGKALMQRNPFPDLREHLIEAEQRRSTACWKC